MFRRMMLCVVEAIRPRLDRITLDNMVENIRYIPYEI